MHGTVLIGRHVHQSDTQNCQGRHSVFCLHGKHSHVTFDLGVISADVRKVLHWK